MNRRVYIRGTSRDAGKNVVYRNIYIYARVIFVTIFVARIRDKERVARARVKTLKRRARASLRDDRQDFTDEGVQTVHARARDRPHLCIPPRSGIRYIYTRGSGLARTRCCFRSIFAAPSFRTARIVFLELYSYIVRLATIDGEIANKHSGLISR